MLTIKQSKPKLLDVLDNLILHLQTNDDRTGDVEWQVVMVAREVVASSSVAQLAKAIEQIKHRVG